MSGILISLFGLSNHSSSGSYVVNVGYYTYGAASFIQGFFSTYGSVTPPAFSNTGTAITGLYWNYNDRAGTSFLSFTINGSVPQSTFTNLTVSGLVFSSMSANFSNSGSDTSWTWLAPYNPFPTVGANVTAQFS